MTEIYELDFDCDRGSAVGETGNALRGPRPSSPVSLESSDFGWPSSAGSFHSCMRVKWSGMTGRTARLYVVDKIRFGFRCVAYQRHLFIVKVVSLCIANYDALVPLPSHF